MTALDQKIQVHPRVVETELDEGEIALLHLEGKMYYSLNTTGARIWQVLKKGYTLEKISDLLQNEFDVDREQADRSVLELVDELFKHDLVQSED